MGLSRGPDLLTAFKLKNLKEFNVNTIVKPVPKKKHVPKTPSEIVSDDPLYSRPCRVVNNIANKIVEIEPSNDPFLSPFINE